MLVSKRFILMTIAALGVASATLARTNGLIHRHLEPETLRYSVMFKWGLINKKAGSATLSLTHGSDSYKAHLAARSEPWADRIFRVRDTLNGHMTYSDFTPLYYEKIAHEGNEHKHDVVNYDYTKPGKV